MEKPMPLEKIKMPKLRDVLGVLALAAVYFLAGKAGLTLAFVQSNATAIWAPTGISLAALLIFGTKAWPGVFLGALFTNLATPHTGWSSLGIAVGNTLEALAGATLVNRFARGREAFQLSGDILRFVILGGLVAPLVSATLGVASLLLGGLTTLAESPVVWVTWWLGDMGGAILVAPLLILWANYRPARFNGRKAMELGALFLILFFMGWVEFGGGTGLSTRNYPFQFLFVPLLLWAAVGFGTLETANANFVLTLLSVWGTVHGFGPFKGPDDNASLLFLQSFMSVIGVTVLVLAASVSERKLAEELVRINRIMEEEIGERKGLEKSLQESNENFRLLSEASREGVLLSAGGVILGANQNFCGMFGYELDEVIGSHSTDYVADECKALVQSHISLNDDSRYETLGRRKNGADLSHGGEQPDGDAGGKNHPAHRPAGYFGHPEKRGRGSAASTAGGKQSGFHRHHLPRREMGLFEPGRPENAGHRRRGGYHGLVAGGFLFFAGCGNRPE